MSRQLIAVSFALILLTSACGSSPESSKTAQPSRSQVSPNAKDEKGQTALMRAIQNPESAAEVERLLNEGADLNVRTESGVTALILAAGIGPPSTVKLLIDKGADVNLKTPGNYTALMSAALNGQTEIVKLLLDSGADPTVRDAGGRTAAKYAEEKEHRDIMALLQQRSTSAPAKK